MFGRKHKIRKAVRRALESVVEEDDQPDFGPVEALAPALRGLAYGSLALALHHDERPAAARAALERGLAVLPDELDLHQLAVVLATEDGRLADAIVAQRRVVAACPRQPEPLAALATLLMAAEQVDDAIALLEPHRRWHDPEIDHRLGEALFVRGDREAALELLGGVCAYYDTALKQLSGADWHALKSRADEADRLRDDIYAERHGREATIELAAAAGKLDASAGVNYRLLGARLAAAYGRVAEVLELEDPDATERRARRMLDGDPERAAGLVLLGSAQLRRGAVAPARKTFERACEADGRCFAAFLGLGAAIDHDRHGLHRRAAALPAAPAFPRELAMITPDLAALTDLERRVVWASMQPLASLLPVLAEHEVTMRLLPIDVRATDVGLFEDVAGVRHDDDQRSDDAISGLATHGGAIAKIEELLDIVSDAGWTFAHELAHLAFFHMPDQLAAPVHALYQRATEVGYANTEYALSNPDEFFAVSYADYLRIRHQLPDAPIADDAGIQDALTAYFDGLGRDR